MRIMKTTHGITNRMTGGGTASCLQTLEAGGLGEGWSDAMAEYVHSPPSPNNALKYGVLDGPSTPVQMF